MPRASPGAPTRTRRPSPGPRRGTARRTRWRRTAGVRTTLRESPAGDLRDLFVLLDRVLAGRELQQVPEIDPVRQRQERRVPERQALLRPDDDEVGEWRKEADDLDRVLVVQLDLLERPAVL